MSGGVLIVIFHYDGEFKFDMIHPVYEGRNQKTMFIQSDITFLELMNIALETSQWEETCGNLSIRYLHHNGHVFSLATIEDDSDIKCMLTFANHNTNVILLYINRRPIGNAKHIGEHRGSFEMDMNSLRGKQTDCSGSNHNMKFKVLPVQNHEIPTVNLCEDNDIQFSEGQNIGSDELQKESYCVLNDRVDVSNLPNDREFVPIEIGNTRANLARNSIEIDKRPPMLNVGEPNSYNRKVIFEDDMVPEEFDTELEHNSSREMWLGRKFPNHDDFRRTLAKFAIYNNFTLQHLKIQQFKVTARCKKCD